MGFRLQQQSMTLNNLTSIHCSVVSVMRVVTKRLRLKSRGFPYKVALYLSYLHIKFDDKTKGIPSNLNHFLIHLRPKLN